jgi:hypothetical protein
MNEERSDVRNINDYKDNMGKSGAERQSEETKVRLIYYIEIL